MKTKLPKVRRVSTQKALVRMLNRQASTINALMERATPLPPVRDVDGDKFVHCWAVYGRPVTQALDARGQVWELHTIMDQATKTVSEQFWTPLGMERRGKGGA